MSGIQLLPENGGEPIDVPDTSTVIGRGAFLKVIDKRVSRNHALLEVIDGKLHVKPTHTNPCFFRRGGKGTQQVLTRDVRQPLEEGDMFGLLPDQLFYTITYGSSSLNGVKTNVERQKLAGKKEPAQPSPARKNDKISKSVKKEVQEEDTRHKPQEKGSFRDVLCADGLTMALPLTKKRKLPAWMIQLSNSSAPAVKKKATAAKTASPAKRAAPCRTAPKKKYTDDFFDGDEEDERPPQKSRKPASNEDYKEKSEEEPHRRGKAGRKRQQQYESDDEDQQPKKRKAGKAKPRKKESDEDDEDLGITTSRHRGGRNFGSRRQDESGESLARRPKRAATKNIGSYEEYFLGGNEFDVSGGAQARGDSDSDFHVEANQEGDSGSDWDKRRGSPKKPAKKPAGRTPVRGARKRKEYRDSDSEEDFEDSGEEYIPRPSKRRGTDGQRRKKPVDSEEEEEEEEEVQVQRKAKRGPSKTRSKTKKTPCYYGVKCYRRNPDHFKQFSHPGDSEEEEEEEEEEERHNKKGAKTDRGRGDNKVGKPEPVKAPVKKTKKKSDDEEDDDLPNMYDYNDSFIDDGGSQSLSQSQRTDDGSDDDVAQLKKEAKAFVKNRKMMKPVADHL